MVSNASFVGGSKGVLRDNRRAGNGLANLYDSNCWDPWNRDTDRKSWKVYRHVQYRKAVPTFKALTLVETE